jgi:hypothetical protein
VIAFALAPSLKKIHPILFGQEEVWFTAALDSMVASRSKPSRATRKPLYRLSSSRKGVFFVFHRHINLNCVSGVAFNGGVLMNIELKT